jgi:DNA repair exonuclease SbcCD ATPase subunit
MQRTTLSGMILGLLLSCFSGVVRASQVDELREKAKAIRKEASALAEKGDKEQAERLEKESAKLLEAAERMERKDKERGEKRDRPDIDKEVRFLKDRLNDLAAKERKMKEAQAPKQELAEVREQIAGTERELHMIHLRHAGKAELPPEYRPQAEKLEAVARRIHHIRVAAENLKLAEAHDLAHQLMEKAEGMERELQEGKQRLAAEMQKRQVNNDGLEIVRDLRAENERLRSEINELRQKVENR